MKQNVQPETISRDFLSAEILRHRMQLGSNALHTRLTAMALVCIGFVFTYLVYDKHQGPKVVIVNAQTGAAKASWGEEKPVWQQADEKQRLFFLKKFIKLHPRLNVNPTTVAYSAVDCLNLMTAEYAQTCKNQWESDHLVATVQGQKVVVQFDVDAAQIRPVASDDSFDYIVRGSKKVTTQTGSGVGELQFVQMVVKIVYDGERTEDNLYGLGVKEWKEEIISHEPLNK